MKIIKSRRKTLSLQITEDASLIVRAPYSMSQKTIHQIIIKHKDWIEKKQREMIKRSKFAKHEFKSGETFLYLGNLHKLKIVEDQNSPLIFDGSFFLFKSHSNGRETFLKWYKLKSYEIISERVDIYAKKYGFEFGKLRITDAQKRWASCSSNGNLNFSWRLVMAPIEVIDYVVIHELVHLVERNHSKLFWAKVRLLYPQYEKEKGWLKENGYLLNL